MQSTLPIQLDSAPSLQQLPRTQLPRTLAGKLAPAVAATAFLAICAHISVPLYFTPVPLTLQTFAVILIGIALGPALGFSTMVLYLAEGAAGLPVFSPHGPGGVAQLFGPTGGFLAAYPLAAAAAGAAARSLRRSHSQFAAAVLAGVAASILFFAMGATWLAHLLHLSPGAAWHMAIAPFLPGEIFKVTAAAGASTSLSRWRRP
jgi:biotin transport system substrate-specific component